MRTTTNYREIFCKRLKASRLALGLSQKKLGILAGIDEFAASSRINRYERGIHEVDIQTAQHLAVVLNVPLAYFYAEDDRLAELILAFNRSSSQT
ncbi:helix-turn-helix transcriptional regulator [Cedecea davisae]|uniref:Helix-turn-helix transcriptional regulator n=1 Tax=Cedecea davisae TaxID=158484 RepID=A0ABS6DKF5_9ENTR|nr:helix-turn-helix transcriptional regulator [Cedecea davisae]MBU4683706.1 helix-turn-helix transcriptional regulator [Cedecea davisae]MBU4687109.1 helix-turn-helix transcriptional regulator [Cedecea davisae]